MTVTNNKWELLLLEEVLEVSETHGVLHGDPHLVRSRRMLLDQRESKEAYIYIYIYIYIYVCMCVYIYIYTH